MIKYVVTAMVLKAFSISPFTRRLYRRVGNILGAQRRTKSRMPQYYFARVDRTLRLNRDYGFPKDGDRLLEIGTGWLHWEAVTAKLFFDIQALLYDIWDNRQMSALKNYLTQLDSRLHELHATDAQKERARRIIAEIMKLRSFRDLYGLLDFEYHVDSNGVLDQLRSEKFDVVISAGVMEHVQEQDAPVLVSAMSEMLKPGGYSVHEINLRDHLWAYDRSVSPKQYLKYSDTLWKTWFENHVQYINRIQNSEWLAMFEKCGLELVKKDVEALPRLDIAVDNRFQGYHSADLCCCGLRVVHRKAEPKDDVAKPTKPWTATRNSARENNVHKKK